MAHVAKLTELVQSLIARITGATDGRKVKDSTIKSLRDAGHARTNQFAVKARLDGLVEKFTVLDRDDLATALQLRLDELPASEKILPEILALLLDLSDRPQDKTRPADVEDLGVAAADASNTGLTWAEIVRDDPFDDDGIWDDIERGYHSSGDEAGNANDIGLQQTLSTRATSVAEDESIEALARAHLSKPDEHLRDEYVESKVSFSGSDLPRPLLVPELTLIRESLFMLRGLPSSVFTLDDRDGLVSMKLTPMLTASSPAAVCDVLEQLADTGSQLNSLRRWVAATQQVPHMRTCQNSIQLLLLEFNTQLSSTEQYLVTPEAKAVVSILRVSTEVQMLARPLMGVFKSVQDAKGRISAEAPFALLDSLHTEACQAQAAGQDLLFNALTAVLFPGTSTYLRAVAEWITTGQLQREMQDFLVVDQRPECDMGQAWHARYDLRRLDSGRVSAPCFVLDFADKIFALGKATIFVHLLQQDGVELDAPPPALPDLSPITQQLEETSLLPFSQLFHDTLSNWIDKISLSVAPSSLAHILLDKHGLLNDLASFDFIFSSRDGMLFHSFAETVFFRIDTPGGVAWSDRFLLTELARDTLGSAPNVQSDNLSVTAQLEDKHAESVIKALGAVNVEYYVSWLVQNIIRQKSSVTHSRLFAFLLQVSGAKYILDGGFFSLRSLASTTLQSQTRRLLRFRQRMLALLDILHTHLTTAAGLLAVEMRDALSKASDIGAMAAVYVSYDKRLALALLSSENLAPIRDAVTGLLVLCERLRESWNRVVGAGESAEEVEGRASHGPTLVGIASMEAEYERDLSFVTAGVRGISRACGERLFETLADRLEWGVR